MGALLSKFVKNDQLKNYVPDFENASPDARDEQLHTRAKNLVELGKQNLEALQNYQVAAEAVRRALRDPNSESECFAEVLDNINCLSDFWSFSTKLAEVVESLLVRMAEDVNTPGLPLEALAVKYAELLKIAVEWDFAKMMKSSLINDLSFYRRCMDRQAANHNLPVTPDATTHISMMLAQPLPMLNSCMAKCKPAASKNANVATAAGKLSEISRLLIQNEKFSTNSEFYSLCLYSMAGSFVLHDAISKSGAFKSKSVNAGKVVKMAAKTWPDRFPNELAASNQAKNLLQYGAPNYARDSTKKMKKLLE